MIGKPQRLFDRPGAMTIARRRPLDQKDGQAEDARGDDLAIGGVAAGILADDHIDAAIPQQRHLRLDGEGAVGEQVFHIGGIERRIDGIDAAHEIMVLRRGVEGLGLLPADGEKDAARLPAQRRHRLGDRGDARPAVAVRFLPAEAFQPEQGDAGRLACGVGIGGNLSCEGMGGVDEEIDGLAAKIGDKSLHAAETAAAHRHRLRRGIERAAGERQRDGEIGSYGKPGRKVPGLGRAAQYEDASLVHA